MVAQNFCERPSNNWSNLRPTPREGTHDYYNPYDKKPVARKLPDPGQRKKKWFRDSIQQLVQVDAETHSQTLGGVKQT